jgi:hypothetical protein
MSRVQRTFLQWVWLLGVLPSIVHADGYGLFSRHEALKGLAVIDAGDVEIIDPPSGKIGVNETVKIGSNCFDPLGSLGTWGYGKKAGLVLVDRSRAVKLALIESSIGSIKVEVLPVTQIACTSSSSEGLPQDIQQRLQELRRKQELRQLELERLRQQRQ